MTVRNKLPVPQARLPNHLPAPEVQPPERSQTLLGIVADLVARLQDEMSGAASADILAELVSRLETALPGVTFNRDALRGHAEAIHVVR